jgi:genome maintenance exonuclease 1
MTFQHVHIPKFEEMSTKTIDGRRWYKTPEGNYYPSITSVLGAKEKPHLDQWRKMLGNENADKETARCADRGTAIHLMAEKYLNNEEGFTTDQPIEYIKLFNQLKLALKRINNIRIQEIPLYSDTLMVAGRVDCIAEFDGVLSVIDFKTSNNNKTDSMIEDYFLQETFYALAYYELYKEHVKQIVTLITVEKGIVPLVFKKDTTPFINTLADRIEEFYQKHV